MNEYYICSRHAAPVRIDLSDDRPVPDAEIAYFIRAFRLLEAHYELEDQTIVFAWGANVRIPKVGDNVIVLLYGDEQCRIPGYINDIRAMIKCYGLFPNFRFRQRPLRLAQIEIAEFLRNLAVWLPTGWRWLLSSDVRKRCHLIPVGYGLPTSVVPLDFDSRPLIASFWGSIPANIPLTKLRGLVGTPKIFSRRAMMRAMEVLARTYGNERVPTSLTPSFGESIKDEAQIYSQIMAQTKICIAPRGTAHETWRMCDGLRFGCVVIADYLPKHPFYRGSPIIQIGDWSEMPQLVENLLRDPFELKRMSEASYGWWRDHLSEDALAATIAKALKLRPIPVPHERMSPVARP